MPVAPSHLAGHTHSAGEYIYDWVELGGKCPSTVVKGECIVDGEWSWWCWHCHLLLVNHMPRARWRVLARVASIVGLVRVCCHWFNSGGG